MGIGYLAEFDFAAFVRGIKCSDCSTRGGQETSINSN